MLKCPISKINEFLTLVSKDYKVYVPVDAEKNRVVYKEFKDGTVISDALKTDRSAKDFFFPQSEDLMRFRTEGKNIEIMYFPYTEQTSSTQIRENIINKGKSQK